MIDKVTFGEREYLFWISYYSKNIPAGIYLLKGKNRNTRMRNMLEVNKTTPERRYNVVLVPFC